MSLLSCRWVTGFGHYSKNSFNVLHLLRSQCPFAKIQPNPPLRKLHAIPLDPVIGHQIDRCLALHFPFWGSCRMLWSPLLSLLFSWLNNQVTSVTSHVTFSWLIAIFIAILWTVLNSFISFWYCGTQNCTQDLRWGYTSAEQSGTITNIYFFSVAPNAAYNGAFVHSHPQKDVFLKQIFLW